MSIRVKRILVMRTKTSTWCAVRILKVPNIISLTLLVNVSNFEGMVRRIKVILRKEENE